MSTFLSPENARAWRERLGRGGTPVAAPGWRRVRKDGRLLPRALFPVVFLVLALSSCLSACGARLTPQQIAALNENPAAGGTRTGTGRSAGSAAAAAQGSSSAAPTAGSAAATGASGSGGATAGAATARATGTASANSSTPGLSVASSVCSGAASGPGVSSSEIDVGAVTTETGPVPGLFQSVIYGDQAFAGYINSVGGICGRKLVYKVADDDLDASQNATATQSLAGSVMAFVGGFSGVDQGSATVLGSDGIPDVQEAISSQLFDLSNNFSPSPVPCGENLAPFVTFKQKYPNAITHMAVLSLNQSTDLFETQCEETALESIGYKFVYSDLNIPLTETDFSTDAQGMKSNGAEGLLFVATAPFYADVARALQNAGVQLQLPTYSTNAYDAQYIQDAGSAANGTIIASFLAMYQGEDAASNPVIALFDKWYAAVAGGGKPTEYAAWAWMSGMLFVEGLDNGGGLTRTNLLNGLRQVTSFDAGAMQSPADPAAKKPSMCYLIIDVTNGKFARDPSDPSSGMNCANAPDWDYVNG